MHINVAQIFCNIYENYYYWYGTKVEQPNVGWFVGCLGFMAYRPLWVILRLIHFYANSSISNNSV